MGTTIHRPLHATEKAPYIAHVGDSRAYLIRNGAIMQRDDRSHAGGGNGDQAASSPPSEAQTHPKRNYITRALGTAETVEVDLLRLDCPPGRRVPALLRRAFQLR